MCIWSHYGGKTDQVLQSNNSFVHLIHLLTGFESVLLKYILLKLAIQQLEKNDRVKKY